MRQPHLQHRHGGGDGAGRIGQATGAARMGGSL